MSSHSLRLSHPLTDTIQGAETKPLDTGLTSVVLQSMESVSPGLYLSGGEESQGLHFDLARSAPAPCELTSDVWASKILFPQLSCATHYTQDWSLSSRNGSTGRWIYIVIPKLCKL